MTPAPSMAHGVARSRSECPISLALFFYLLRRMKSVFCIHTEVITHPTPSPPFFYDVRTRARTHIVAITRALRRISPNPRWVSHTRVTTRHRPPTHRIESPRSRSIARHTRPRRAQRSFIMLARTSVPTRTVATFERYARDDNECAVLADAPREERGETRDARRMMMRANGGMTDP